MHLFGLVNGVSGIIFGSDRPDLGGIPAVVRLADGRDVYHKPLMSVDCRCTDHHVEEAHRVREDEDGHRFIKRAT